jgi:outer membrane lipoprotein-sorting protein
MRHLRPIAFVAALMIAGPVLADDAEARKVVDKALQAMGNPSGKMSGVTWKGKGTFYGMGDGVPYTGTWSVQPPDKFRMDIENAFVIIVNGDKGWINGQEMTKDQLNEQLEGVHSNWVSQIYPLKEKAFTLTLIGESKVDDKPALGVKVAHKGRRDVTLYFDKESGLPVKIEHMVKDDQTGSEVKQESIVKEWTTVDGMKVPSKMDIKRDGKKFVDGEMTEYKLSEKLPDETFAKP